jgi:hypothetical protein
MVATPMRRPTGATVIAAVLFWFFISAIGNLLVSRSLQTANAFPPSSPGARFVVAVSGSGFVVLVMLYGLTALVAAVATWRMRRWMPMAFLLWSVSAISLGAFFMFAVPQELLWGGELAGMAFVGVMAAVLWWVYRYLRRICSGVPSAAL